MGKKSRDKAARREKLQAVREGKAPAPSPAPPPSRPAAPAVSDQTRQVWQLLEAGRPEDALRLLQSTPVGPGGESQRRELMGHCLVAMHQYDRAYPLLAAAAERGMRPEVQLALAETEANLGLVVHAERRIKRIGQAYPTHPAMPQLREFARESRSARDQEARQACASPPAFEEAAYQVESAYLPLSTGDFDRAIELCRSSIEACPAYSRAYLTLASALGRAGDENAAVEALEEAAALDSPATATAAFHLAQLYRALGRDDEARVAANRLLEQDSTPENRPLKAETLAVLEDHSAVRALLIGQRDLSPREHFLLGAANSHLGEIPSARREVRSAIQGGYQAPLAYWAMAQLDGGGNTPIPYFGALELAGPLGDQAIRRAIEQPDEAGGEALRKLINRPALQRALETLLQQDPVAGIRAHAALGTPEAIAVLRMVSSDESRALPERLIALSSLRDRGEIAEDEPIDLTIDGEVRTIVLGRHRIIADPVITLPSEDAARLYQEGAEMYSADPETAYARWAELDEHHSQTARMRSQIASLSLALGRVDEARDWIERALEIEPESPDAFVGQATVALTTGDLRTALEAARRIDALDQMPASTFFAYQSIRDHLNTLLESPLADALMEQAALAGDEESAEASREMAGMLGDMQRTLALTQYLRQRPVTALREDLSMAEVVDQMDPQVLENAAWLFGFLPELEDLAAPSEHLEEEEDEEPAVNPAARELVVREMLQPDRLAEGLPGLPESDLQGLQWLLDRGGISPLDEYLAAFPADETAPGDMVLEYGLVVEGRLAGRVTRLIPVDLRDPLREALARVSGEAA